MATSMKRLTVSLPDDIERGVTEVKGKSFINSPQSKVIWHLLRLGIEADKRNDPAEMLNAATKSGDQAS